MRIALLAGASAMFWLGPAQALPLTERAQMVGVQADTTRAGDIMENGWREYTFSVREVVGPGRADSEVAVCLPADAKLDSLLDKHGVVLFVQPCPCETGWELVKTVSPIWVELDDGLYYPYVVSEHELLSPGLELEVMRDVMNGKIKVEPSRIPPSPLW